MWFNFDTVKVKCIFSRSPTTVSTTMMLERLNLTLPTHIQSATTQDMEILTEKLLAEAQENMFAIRTAYLASMSQNEKFVTFSRYTNREIFLFNTGTCIYY